MTFTPSHQPVTIRVRGYHLDLYQHVNNARYLEFLEEARWQYFEDTHLLEDFLKSGLGFAVVNININYRRAAVMNDTLCIHTRVKEVGERKGVIEQIVYLNDSDTVVADALITFVTIDLKTGKSVPVEGHFAELLQAAVQA